jgi:hypothetical protein
VNALSHPFWVNGLDNITRNNNHIASLPITTNHPEFRWRCDKIVAKTGRLSNWCGLQSASLAADPLPSPTRHQNNPTSLARRMKATYTYKYTYYARIRAMGRVTIYLDDEMEKRMAANAKAMKISKSRWIANAIREKLVDEWPANVRELAGSWEDFPTLEEIRETKQRDVTWEALRCRKRSLQHR